VLGKGMQSLIQTSKMAKVKLPEEYAHKTAFLTRFFVYSHTYNAAA